MRKHLFQGLLFILHLGCALSLRFSHDPITVESDVIVINKPAKLTCHYVKFRTETVREITWYLAYDGFRSKVFHYHVTTGKKENSIYSHIRTMGDEATESELNIVLTEFRGNPVTIGCEVEVLRDNGYGKLSHSKKMVEAEVTVVDTNQHQMMVKIGKWDNQGTVSQHETSVGQPLIVSCISRGANPSPNLTLTLNDKPWEETSATSRVEQLQLGIPSGMQVLEGRMDTVYDSMFITNGAMSIECKATYEDFVLDKKTVGLTKQAPRYVSDTNNRFRGNGGRPIGLSYEDPVVNFGGGERRGRIVHHSDEGHDADVIHNRLLDLLDPARHMHIGIPYDFYSGYILMVAKNVDTGDDDQNTGSYYGSRGSAQQSATACTHLYGKLPDKVVMELQRNYGRFQKITDEKYKIDLNPVDILNLLGHHGFRVIGFTAEADKKMVWTLEQKDFEMENNLNSGRRHEHF